jgi:hypothetical protein
MTTSDRDSSEVYRTVPATAPLADRATANSRGRMEYGHLRDARMVPHDARGEWAKTVTTE